MISKRKALFLTVLTISGALLVISEMRGQTTLGTISGVVQDETGAVLPGVTIRAQHLETGTARTTITDDAGRYRLAQLGLGEQELQAELAGFQTLLRRGIALSVGQELEVNIVLRVGEMSEKVEVTGEAPLVETTTSTISGLVDEKQIRDLPLNGRSLEQLAVLQPGVTAARAGSANFQGGNVSRINIGGARSYQNTYLLDGSDVGGAWGNTPGSVAGVMLGVDAIREFRVLVNNFSAEFGRAAGGVISAATLSGTNDLHGSLFEFLRNSALDARNFFDRGSGPPPFKRNQFGFTLGGPIRKDQTFFFGSYEALRQRLTTTQISNVPTLQARQGILPQRRIEVNSKVVPYLSLLPLPNGRDNRDGTAEFIGPQRSPTDDDYFAVRVDHTFSPKDSVYARYTFDDGSVGIPLHPGVLGETDLSRNQYFTLEETKVISPVLLNSFRLGVNRSTGKQTCAQVVTVPTSLNLVPGRPFGTSGGLTIVGIAGLSSCGTAPRLDFYNLTELTDNIAKEANGHSVKVGLNVKHMRLNVTAQASQAGEYNFTTLENFLLGLPSTFRAPFPDAADATRSWRQTLYAFYVQDDFKVRSNVTMNVGLRYEFTTAPIEVYGRSARLLHPLDRSTTVLGREPYVETSKNDFAPRVGFAWDPWRNGKTSIRGGIGVFFEPVLPYSYGLINGVRQPPFFLRANTTNPPFPNAYEIIKQFPAETTLNNFSPTRTPYTIQFNLNIQREFIRDIVFSIGYTGSRALHLYYTVDANSAHATILGDGRKFFPAGSPRRNSFFGEHLNIMTDAQSWYHGMVLSLRKRLGGGGQFQLSYTAAKATDNASSMSAPEGRNSSRNTMDPEDLNRDYSISSHHIGQNLVLNYTTELPFGRGRRFGGSLTGFPERLVGGWQIGGIATLASGIPVNVELGFNAARNASTTGIGFQQRPDLIAGRSNNPVLGGPDRYLDAGAFRVPDPGFFGNLGRNTVTGPGYVNFDVSLMKKTKVAESREVQFRAELFNVMNHPNFDVPSRIVFNSASGVPLGAFGRINGTITTARQIQFGLKIIF